MTTILTWNIQCGRGCGGRVDLARIAGVIRAMGDHDVICLQEVCRHTPELDDGAATDQVADLGRLFPEFEPVFGAAIDRAGDPGGPRRQFGNLILSRLPVVQAFRHALPQPADASVKHMPRQATEVVVPRHHNSASGPWLRIVTTHLEYHSKAQRLAQAARLLELQAEITGNQESPPIAPPNGPYAAIPRPASGILCGDFNIAVGGDVYNRLIGGGNDAWPLVHQRPHDPTCGIFDRTQWPQGEHCRDFFFVSPDLVEAVTGLNVDLKTDASDHQPLRLVLSD